MHLKIRQILFLLGSMLIIYPILILGNVQAQTIYVTDNFKITLRTGPNNSRKILRMLPSNTPLQVLEEDQGWLKVRTEKGQEGWILKRYTMQETPKKIIIERLKSKNKNLEEKIEELSSRASSLKKENNKLISSLKETSTELNNLSNKYEKLKKDSGNVLTLKKEFQETEEKFKNASHQLEEISQENKKLRASNSREWFLTGAAVVGISALLGFIIGRIQKRRSRKLYL